MKDFFNKPDFGIFLLRVSMGVFFIIHGLPKFMGGEKGFEKLGSHMELIGIDFAPVFWGFLAAAVETIGGLLLALGFYTRVNAFLLMLVMIMATLVKVDAGADFGPDISHPLKMVFVFAALTFMGAGQYAIDKK